jgi:hypothetical protein
MGKQTAYSKFPQETNFLHTGSCLYYSSVVRKKSGQWPQFCSKISSACQQNHLIINQYDQSCLNYCL